MPFQKLFYEFFQNIFVILKLIFLQIFKNIHNHSSILGFFPEYKNAAMQCYNRLKDRVPFTTWLSDWYQIVSRCVRCAHLNSALLASHELPQWCPSRSEKLMKRWCSQPCNFVHIFVSQIIANYACILFCIRCYNLIRSHRSDQKESSISHRICANINASHPKRAAKRRTNVRCATNQDRGDGQQAVWRQT